jgi:DNA-binding CsgD family transcriptional regulator
MPVTTSTELDLARAAFDHRAWREAVVRFEGADSRGELTIDDLERVAIAIHMLGRRDDAVRFWERAHLAALQSGDVVRAAREALHIVMNFAERGEVAQLSGWYARARRLLDETKEDCIERGYLMVPAALRAREEGDLPTAMLLFDQIAAIADRFRDPEAIAMVCLGRGTTLIQMGEIGRGVELLDEAMVAVTAGEVSPINVGTVYCGSIEAFAAVLDLRRAQEWTDALSRWCESQPDAVPFRGRCLVFRSEMLQLHGRWEDAVEEVRRAHEWLMRPPIEPAVGESFYQQGELHRLQGELAAAEAAYVDGATWGRQPDPGLALLRLAQGDTAAAAASIRRALDESTPSTRFRLLEPFVEITLAVGDIDPAATAAAELVEAAGAEGSPQLLQAAAARADGVVRLARGDGRGALTSLRRAFGLWQALDAPYESARTRVAVARACRSLGDADTAAIELAAARDAFVALGARPDIERVETILGEPSAGPGGLSARELEVLGHLASGATNREIAARLGISDRTVDRHVSNIFTKLDVSSRAAATAFAYQHRLV